MLGSRVLGCKCNTRTEQPDPCSGSLTPGGRGWVGWKCCQRVEKMPKGGPGLAGVRGRHLKRRQPVGIAWVFMYTGGSRSGEGDIPSQEELITHSLILL